MGKAGNPFILILAAIAWNWAITSAQAAPSFEEVVHKVEATITPTTARRGETVLWKVTVELKPGWHTYPLKQVDPNALDNVNKIQFPKKGELVPVGLFKEPPFRTKPEPLLDIKALRYNEGTVVWEHPLVVRPDAPPGKLTYKVSLNLQVCDEHSCLPPRKMPVEVTLDVSDAPAVAVDPKYLAALNGTPEVPVVPTKPIPEVSSPKPAETTPKVETKGPPYAEWKIDVSDEQYKADMDAVQAQIIPWQSPPESLLSFILAGVFWGAVSLVTPCVFPMIPITVSFFLKQSEKEHHRPITLASVYCGTIVIVLSLAALLMLSFFRELSVSPLMNFALGVLFIYFALSLFGMYEIELPTSLARFTSAREGQGGLVGTVFMALTFTIVSFACVAPFLGGFGGTSATSTMSWTQRSLGALAYSATFASPFFILALFPTLLKKMPKSGTWLNSVKVVMGFLEVAAALKFLRAGELVFLPQPMYFTYDVVLGLYITLSLLCGLYLLGVYRLPHDTPIEHLGVGRMLLSVGFLALALYLTPGLFRYGADGAKQRPTGIVFAWVDSFLLPDPEEQRGDSHLPATANLKMAVAEARALREKTGRPQLIFLDFTGKVCTNCKINEREVFSKPQFRKLFENYLVVQLYADQVPNAFYSDRLQRQFGNNLERPEDDAQQVNLAFQKKTFNSETLPTYVILEPRLDGTIKVVGVNTEGKINNADQFARFLGDPL